MNKQEQLARLNHRVEDPDETALEELLENYYNLALSICGRREGEETVTLMSLVREAVVAAYVRRGDEGVSGSSVGGQSYTYQDIEDRLVKSLIRAGQRVLRL